jgi:hypothetical protein
MSQLVDYVDELIQEVGPRPAGTQQEHQAAEIIASRLDEFGLKVDIEEFPCVRHVGWVRALYYALCVIGAAVAIFVPVIRAVGVILVIVGAVLMILDLLGNNPLYSLFKSSLSQNVVGRYIPPGLESSSRNRKVVILAHYDSARTMVQAAPPLVSHYALLRRIIRIAMIALIVLSLLMLIPFPAILLTILSVLTGIVAAIVLLALLAEIVNFFMPFNQGANCNGSGIGVLYGLAEALNSGADSGNLRARSGRAGRADRSGRSGRATGTERSGSSSGFGSGEARSSRRSRTERAGGAVSERSGHTTRGDRSSRAAAGAGLGAGLGAGVSRGGATLGSALQATEETASADGRAATAENATPQLSDDMIVPSIGDNLVNPFISQRPPLSEIEEANRLREEERAQRLEEQRKRIAVEESHTEDGVPTWFAQAKKNAEKSTERKSRQVEETEVVRSRFADVPTVGSPVRQAPTTGTSTGTPTTERDVPEIEDSAGSGGALVDDDAQATGVLEAQTAAADVAPVAEVLQAVEVEQTAEVTAAVPSVREHGAVTSKPDFTGLDRQAFKVLPGDESRDSAVIIPSQTTADEQDDRPAPAQQRLRSRLRDLPSFSAENTGNIPVQQAGLDTAPATQEELFPSDTTDSVISSAGSFIPLGTTGIMKPIGEELLAYHDEEDLFIADADDTFVPERYTESGAAATPDAVSIPESRVKSFLGSVGDRLSGKKKEKLEGSPSSWLGVDEGYDARKEGKDIGSWENFNDEEDDSWSGGAFGGASFEENVDSIVELSNELLDKEVWLVALGANESKNAGIKNLFANHDSELKSALFVNLLGVGIGDLVFTISEGNFRAAQTDHRIQSLIQSAAQNMAIPIAPVQFSAFATDCTEALSRGGRAISIMGLGQHLPVGWRWTDDDVSRLREDNLQDVAALVLETIKNS